MLRVFGEKGDIHYVNQGIGLGIREHDDVMLGWGLSRKTFMEMVIPAGQFGTIKAVVPPTLNHHAENRIIESSGGSIRFRIYKDVDSANFPAQVSVMPITDERGPLLITDTTDGTKYTYHGTSVANPIVSGWLIDNYPLFTAETQGNQARAPQTSQSIKGRYYYPSTYAVVVQNISNVPVTVYYQYEWHEFF